MTSRRALMLFPAILMAALQVQARLNLPQTQQVVTVPDDVVRMVVINLGPTTGAAPDLQPSAQGLLLSILPTDFRGACNDMIESWGEIAKGTAEWRVRVLLRQGDQVWLAFRCGSRAPDYDKYYDERLALLRLDTGKLELFPFGGDAENDSTLYHLEFAEVLPLDGAQGVAFKVTQPGENPCCDGGDTTEVERLVIFASSSRGVSEALSVVTRENHYNHDDENGDTETVYEAKVDFERDSENRVTAVTAFREEVKDIEWKGGTSEPRLKSERTGTLRYRWNLGRLQFEEIR
jgi:hypothetical protein